MRFIQWPDALSSPAFLIVVVWCVTLILVAGGPINYPAQPSLVVLMTVGAGVVLFLLGYRGGGFMFESWFARRTSTSTVPTTLNRAIIVTSLVGMVGIGFIALDRIVISGVSNSEYSQLLRCAPGLIDSIEIKRTPIMYLGYLMFSFGFVSIVLFLLRGELVRGWAATLAQLSIVSPVGYALLYAGRTPILFILVLIGAAMLVRVGEGRKPLPPGHHLFLKTIAAIGLFIIYSSAMWTGRQNFCIQLTPLIQELEGKQRAAATARARPLGAATGRVPGSDQKSTEAPSAQKTNAVASDHTSKEVISATDLSKQMVEATAAPAPVTPVNSTADVLAVMEESWNVRPRAYVVSFLNAAHFSTRATMAGLSTYFYLTHGVRVIDIAWNARTAYSPQWGVYEIGVLSPLLRVFFPGSDRAAILESQQREAGTYGFSPTVWVAAYIDFGLVGAIIYMLIWGCIAGWSAAGTKRSGLITPPLILAFVLTSILLSLVQGPLGISNSALVLLSMLMIGGVIDLWPWQDKPRTDVPM